MMTLFSRVIPTLYLLLELGKIDEQMFGFLRDRRRGADLAFLVDQLDRI
jgi:hypothetical protein